MNTYEGLFIFPARLKDEQLDAAFARVQEDITTRGGEITKSEVIGKRTFARPMNKRDAGVYTRLHFAADPAVITKLLDRYRLNEDVFRVQIARMKPPAAVVVEEAAPADEAAPAAPAAPAEAPKAETTPTTDSAS